MVCCEICGAAVDTDFHVEVCRYGYQIDNFPYKPIIYYTGDDTDTCFICENCFDENEDSWGSWDSEED